MTSDGAWGPRKRLCIMVEMVDIMDMEHRQRHMNAVEIERIHNTDVISTANVLWVVDHDMHLPCCLCASQKLAISSN
jgi:hypothetical protein